MTTSMLRPTLGSTWGDCLSLTIPLGPRRYSPNCPMPPLLMSIMPFIQLSRSLVSDSLQPHWPHARQAFLSITNSWSLLKLMSIESVMPSNHLILCHPLLLLPSIFPSISIFSNESALHQVAKVLEFQLQHQTFQWTLRTDYPEDGLVGSPCSPGDS